MEILTKAGSVIAGVGVISMPPSNGLSRYSREERVGKA